MTIVNVYFDFYPFLKIYTKIQLVYNENLGIFDEEIFT